MLSPARSRSERGRCSRALRVGLRLLLLVGIVLLGAVTLFLDGARAGRENQLTPEEARKKLQQRQQLLEKVREREKRIAKEAEALARATAEHNRKLIATAQAVQKSEAELTRLEERLGELDAQRALIHGSLLREHKRIGRLLGALQRMGRNPPPVMATERSDALKMVRSAMMLSAVFPKLRQKAETLASRLRELDRVLADIRKAQERLRAENRKLIAERERLGRLLAIKKARLEKTQTALAEVRRAADLHRRSVRSLNELIRRLDQTVKEKTGLGKYNEELAKGVAPGQAEETGDSDRAPAIELRPSTRKLALLSPGRMKPAIPFAKARGRLPMPVKGRRITSFGEKNRFGAVSRGITLETRFGAQVTSPTDGWVVFAEPFRSYGQLLIIAAGDDYYVLLAGMARLDVVVGQFVLSGEPVGRMKEKPRQGEKARGAARKGGAEVVTGAVGARLARAGPGPSPAADARAVGLAPLLYIEFRKDGRPIDPDPWWAKGA